MNRDICKRCNARHCVILFKMKSKKAYVKMKDDSDHVTFNAQELMGVTHILEKYGKAFRYRYNHGESIEQGVEWHFDECVPCNDKCMYYMEQMVSAFNGDGE